MTHLTLAIAATVALAPSGWPAIAADVGHPRFAACTAPAPAPGARIAGPVLQVIDGERFCLAKGPAPSNWILVRLAGAPKSSDRRSLMAAAFAETVECVVERRTAEGVVANCWRRGAPLAALVHEAVAREKGAHWR